MEIYLDLNKARLNTAKLVKKPVQVRGKDGKIHTRMQWVKPYEDESSEVTRRKAEENVERKLPNQDFSNPYLKVEKEEILQISQEEKELKARVKGWLDKYKKSYMPDLYKIMKKLGISDGVDPRDIPEFSQAEGNGMGPIMHMRNMMSLNKKLMQEPELMEQLEREFFSGGSSEAKVATPEKKRTPSKAQEGNNNIAGVLKALSRSEKYDLCKRLGIADFDPGLVEELSQDKGNGMAPIMHMRNMMALKKAIEQDPSILNVDGGGNPTELEEKREKETSDTQLLDREARDFLNKASDDLKHEWADMYYDHKHMKDRIRSEHSHVDRMHMVSALRKILMDNPELMREGGDLYDEWDREQLKNYKITNKNLQKVLRQALGLKGIGDVRQVEKGVEWEFGLGSFARINEDDEGNAVLSVVDTGKDGEGWDEVEYPMSKVREFLEGKKKDKIEKIATPLHRKPVPEIFKALEENFDLNYNEEVAKALQSTIGDTWIATGRGRISHLVRALGTSFSVMRQILDKHGINAIGDEDWSLYAYEHLFEDTKTKDANDYIMRWEDPTTFEDKVDTTVLHESAKRWTPEERDQARREIIKANTFIEEFEDGYGDYGERTKEERETRINEHMHESLQFVPFDLLTDVIAKGGTKFNFVKSHDMMGEVIGGFFHNGDANIYMGADYVRDSYGMFEKDSFDYFPYNPKYANHSMAGLVSHEFAHAIDYYLGNGEMVKWKNTKYSGRDPQVILTSYNKTVERSNPNKLVMHHDSTSQKYFYHKDEWMSSYEGRIYDSAYYDKANIGEVLVIKDGKVTDNAWDSRDSMRGVEHWSENTERYANAFQAYKRWKESDGMDGVSMNDWAKEMHDKFLGMGYGDESNDGDTVKTESGEIRLKSYRASGREGLIDHPIEAYGYFYHKMSQVHPELHTALNEIFGRGDFVDEAGYTPTRTQLFEQGDYTRKSEQPKLIISL